MTLLELEAYVLKIAREMDFTGNPMVDINNRYGARTLATAQTWRFGENYLYLLQFNAICLELPVEILEPIVKHEMLHLITGLGDDDWAFKEACWAAKVPLSADRKLSEKLNPYLEPLRRTRKKKMRVR